MVWGADKAFKQRIWISRWQAQFPFWPPRDASPVTPIEPWGKQFFVYNAPKNVQMKGDPRAPTLDDVRPSWVRDQNAASMLLPEEDMSALPDAPEGKTLMARRLEAEEVDQQIGEETVLCATDFRQRPMMYMTKEEWHEFLKMLPELKAQMAKVQSEIEEADEKGEAMREYWLRRTYIHDKHEEKRVGRMGYGSSFGRSYFSGKVGPRARARFTPETTAELERYNEGRDGPGELAAATWAAMRGEREG
eukprot:CAMPEP_0206466084 /NCGR_PEP_ID=MMETSP0324_2-20121206/28239_1 /ASSEMBLY_ACC=CAM_ASM_000836 /TAXON_ID=2866 /ORGANISM="Crypthecodinium cohnii, Strain Seligo" /LENGTH=247 /DNA_ID=CAMNT_0053939115 /DNA_START=24 /DNA_END=764 /DNA_ORIENTATION=+